MDLSGRVILITGAAQRVGRALALGLSQRGATLILHYNRSKSQALKLAKELPGESHLIKADLSGPHIQTVSRKLIREASKKAKRIDVLINNASVFYPTPLQKISQKDWNHIFTVNLAAPFFLSDEAAKIMLKQKSGHIINLLDATVERPAIKYIPYAISKVALEVATRGLARALAPTVRVNGVAPGPILPVKGASPSERKKAAGRALLKRYGKPADLLAAVELLLREDSFMTGSVLTVDGGAGIA